MPSASVAIALSAKTGRRARPRMARRASVMTSEDELTEFVESSRAFVDARQLCGRFVDVAKFSTRPFMCLAHRHPLRNQLGSAFVEMRSDFASSRRRGRRPTAENRAVIDKTARRTTCDGHAPC